MNDKLLVTVAPCIPPSQSKEISGLDLTPEGIANDVVRAYNAGANIVHLHVWDEKGQPTTDLSFFKRTIGLIQERCDIIIEGSTGGISEFTHENRSIALQANIEMSSLNPGSVNYDQGVYINSPQDINYWALEMHRRCIKPNLVIFEAGMIANSMALVQKGWIKLPILFTFVLGLPGAIPATPKNLLFLSDLIPPNSLWFAVGHGNQNLSMLALAMSMGGQARAGFEDNPYYHSGELAKNNAQLIERVVRIARELDREIASPSEARMILGLSPRASL